MSNEETPSLTGRDEAHGSATDSDSSVPALSLIMDRQPQHYFYLPGKLWSPRYESDFYTVTVGEHQVFVAQPPPTSLPAAPADAHDDAVQPNCATTNILGGNVQHPAVYYKVTVRRARTTTVLWRRYSQFAWLRRQWTQNPPLPSSSSSTGAPSALTGSTKPSRAASAATAIAPTASSSSNSAAPTPSSVPEGFPSSCPFFWWMLPTPHRESFLRQRSDELAAYLDRALGAPGYATHPATVAFLELR